MLLVANDTLGERIRTAYERAGMNRNQFAQQLGTVYHNVIRWEQGANVGAEYLRKIVEVTGADADWLLTGRETEHQPEEGGAGAQVVEEFLAGEAGRVHPDHARELRSVRWGGLAPTSDMVRAMWREMLARDAQRVQERPEVEPPELRPGRRKIS